MSLVSGRRSSLLGILSVCLSSACGPSSADLAAVVVTVSGAPTGAGLRAFVKLAGSDAAGPRDFPAGTERFAVELPVGSTGTVALEVGALLGGCLSAQGTAQVDVPRPGSYPVTVDLKIKSPPDCPQPVCAGELCWQRPLSGTRTLRAAWGTSGRSAFAVGDGGTLLRWNGYFLSAEPRRTDATLRGVGGRGPNDIWAVGDSGTILRYDPLAAGGAGAWAVAPSPTTKNLRAVAGVPGTAGGGDLGALWAVGDGGEILIYDEPSGKFQLRPNPPMPSDLRGLYMSGPNDVWIVGETFVLHLKDGWTVATLSGSMRAIWGKTVYKHTGDQIEAQPRVWVVGDNGVIRQYSGDKFEDQPSGTTVNLNAVWGQGDAVYAAGDGGVVLRLRPDATEWEPAPREAGLATDKGLLGGWAPATGEGLVVGAAGVVLRQTAGRVGALSDQVVAPPLLGLWGSGPDNIWAVGQKAVLRYDGTRWTALRTDLLVTLHGVSGTGPDDVWIAGDRGVVLHWDGKGFADLVAPSATTLRGVWARGKDDVFFVGDQQGNAATILHYAQKDGFKVIPNNAQRSMMGVGRGPLGGAYFVGEKGVIASWDGVTFDGRTLPEAAGKDLNGVYHAQVTGAPAGVTWVYGEGGVIAKVEDDATTWKAVTAGVAAGIRGLAGAGEEMWAAGSNPAVLMKLDGGQFKAVAGPSGPVLGEGLSGVYTAGGVVWLVDQGGGILRSK